jgi:hypothetical protein
MAANQLETTEERNKYTPQGKALRMLERHEAGETVPAIARAFKISHQAAYKLLLTHCPQEWKASQVARALAAHECAKMEIERLKKSKGDARAQVALACAREQLRSSQWELERLFADFYGQRTHVTVEQVGDLADKLRRARERVIEGEKPLRISESDPAGSYVTIQESPATD